MNVEQIALEVVQMVRPTLRAQVGDRTPAQYDRADAIAEAIARAVRHVLTQETP